MVAKLRHTKTVKVCPRTSLWSSKKRTASCVQHQDGSNPSTALKFVKKAKTAIKPDVSLFLVLPLCSRSRNGGPSAVLSLSHSFDCVLIRSVMGEHGLSSVLAAEAHSG